eukprot:m.9716 g.9716  ORF g.9716 m.9716 type:complete len:66 (-) comp5484_c0_seq1:1591-1788(-)
MLFVHAALFTTDFYGVVCNCATSPRRHMSHVTALQYVSWFALLYIVANKQEVDMGEHEAVLCVKV